MRVSPHFVSDGTNTFEFTSVELSLTDYQSHKDAIESICKKWEDTQILHWEEFTQHFGILMNKGNVAEALDELKNTIQTEMK